MFGPPLVMAAAIGIQTATGSQVGPPRALAPVPHLPSAVFLLSLPLAALFEEIGWRGYAQIPLEKRHGPVRAAAILGILWACWHLPLFFIPGLSHEHMSFIPYMAFAVVLCLWFGWLYRHTRSILIATIFHASINFTGILGGGSPGAEITFGVLVFVLTLAVPLPWVRGFRAKTPPAGPDV